MGNKLAKIPKNYNVQNRAEKAIEKHKVKPVSAPKHPSTVEQINKSIRGSVGKKNPEFKEDLDMKHESVISRVNQLKIEVSGVNPEIQRAPVSSRPLPQSREHIDDPLAVLEDPKKIPETKVSLRLLAEILGKTKQAGSNFPPHFVAKEYKLDVTDAENLIKYYYRLDLDEVTQLKASEYDAGMIQSFLNPGGPVTQGGGYIKHGEGKPKLPTLRTPKNPFKNQETIPQTEKLPDSNS